MMLVALGKDGTGFFLFFISFFLGPSPVDPSIGRPPLPPLLGYFRSSDSDGRLHPILGFLLLNHFQGMFYSWL
jgi:hypothetical protein